MTTTTTVAAPEAAAEPLSAQDARLIREAIKHRDRSDFSRDENKRLTALAKAIEDGARLVEPGGLSGAREVGEITEKEKTTVTRWRHQGYLPQPFAILRQGPVWLRADIVEFDRLHRQQQDAAGRRPIAQERDGEADAR